MTDLVAVEAEQSVIGALLLDGSAIERVRLVVTDFARRDHQLIFRAVTELHESRKATDVLTVAAALNAGGDLDAAGGRQYLVSIANNTPSAANVETYADIVRDKSKRRTLHAHAQKIAQLTLGDEPTAAVLDQCERLVLSVRDTRHNSLVMINDAMRDALVALDARRDAEGGITGLPTGYVDLDRELCGLQRGDLIVVAGRPSMGKTSFAMNVAEKISAREPVLVFSLEMDADRGHAVFEALSHSF